MKVLYLITARGNSKGVPGKNVKKLKGKPLICYTLDSIPDEVSKEDICVSTDSKEIIKVVEDYGITVPFIRPDELATDTAGSYDVILHAVNFFKNKGVNYDTVILLQPTSPFRTKQQVQEALSLFNCDTEMVVSVKESAANPYYNLFEENQDEFLYPSKEGNYTRRQDCPKVYKYNGAIYVIDVEALIKHTSLKFSKVKKYLMDEKSSIDIDTHFDWSLAETVLEEHLSNK